MPGPQVTMAPGWGSDGTVFAPLRALLEPVCTVTVLDARGVLELGATGRAGAEPPSGARILVGWSLGALGCLQAALCHPAAVRALVLLGATACLPGDGAGYAGPSRAVLRAMRGRLRRDPRGVAIDFLRQSACPRMLDADELEVRLSGFARMAAQDVEAGLRCLEQTDARDALERLDVPVLLLHGAQDAVVPCAQARDLADALPRAGLCVFAGAGHEPTMRMWRRAARAIRRRVRDGQDVDVMPPARNPATPRADR